MRPFDIYMAKIAAWADQLGHDDRNRLMLQSSPAHNEFLSAFDEHNASRGLSVGQKLGAGFQGNVHRLEAHPNGTSPAFDPAGHVVKSYHVQPGHIMSPLSPFMGRDPLKLDEVPTGAVRQPVDRITAKTPALHPEISSGHGRLYQDIMEDGNPHAYGKLPHRRQMDIAHHAASHLAEKGFIHEDFRPEQFIHMKGTKWNNPADPLHHDGGAFRVGDLGGLRKLTAEEREMHPATHVGKMMTDWHVKGQLSKRAPAGVEAVVEHGVSAYNNKDYFTAGAHLPPEMRGIQNLPKLMQMGAGALLHKRPEVDHAYAAAGQAIPGLLHPRPGAILTSLLGKR